LRKKYAKYLEGIHIFPTFASDLHKVSQNSNNLNNNYYEYF